MNDSHISLRDDYEVTGLELDTLVEAAWLRRRYTNGFSYDRAVWRLHCKYSKK